MMLARAGSLLLAFRAGLSQCWKFGYGMGREGGRDGGWFGIKNNLSLVWRGNATLLILFTIIIVFTILSSLEISLSQSLQNIVFKYLAAHLSLDGRLKLSAQHSPTPLSRWRHFQPYGWLQEMAELEDEENSKHFSIKLRRFPQFGKSNVSKILLMSE